MTLPDQTEIAGSTDWEPYQDPGRVASMEEKNPSVAERARLVLERFTPTPGKALAALDDAGVVIEDFDELNNLIGERDELRCQLDNPVITLADTRAIVTGPVRLAPNLDAWLDAAGNVAELEVI